MQKVASVYQYFGYCHKCGTIEFCSHRAMEEMNLIFVLIRLIFANIESRLGIFMFF